MNAFFRRGVELQTDSSSLNQANARFDYSCDLCCKRGYGLPCDRCPIEVAHDRTVKIIVCLEENRKSDGIGETPREVIYYEPFY